MEKQKIINFRPICIAAAFYAVGIAFAYFLLRNVAVAVICISVLAVFSALAVVFSENKKKSLICLAAFSLIFIIGFGYAEIKINSAYNAAAPSDKVAAEATVDRVSLTKTGSYRVYFRDVKVNGRSFGSAVGYIDDEFVPEVGSRYSFNCELIKRAGREDFYDIFCGVHFSVRYISGAEYVGDYSNPAEKSAAFIKKVLKSGMTGQSYSLAVALVLGDTSLISEDLPAYRFAGIAHAFAVSGLHVGLFFAIFTFIAKRLRLKRVFRFLFILIPTAFYCFMCGFKPSSVRALIMAAVLLLSEDFGFKRDRMSSIALALIVVLSIQPFYLFDIGTRLSFLAVLGIAALLPVLKRGAKPLKKLSDPLCVSMGASLGTMPVLVDMSGYISIISLFANIIFVPLLSLAYQLTVVFAIFGCIEYAVAGSAVITMFLPSALLTLISDVVGFFDFSAFALPLKFGFAAIFYYVGLFFITDFLNIKGKYKAIMSVVAFVLSVIVMLIAA